MNEIRITDRITYLEATESPLSADVGIIRDNGRTWLYDVGNGEKYLSAAKGEVHVVLSHFHPDHTGNISRIRPQALYVSKETCTHVHSGTVINESLRIGSLHIFPIPSSHAKGCLGLEVDETYAFVGDSLYAKSKDGGHAYNAQLLKAEIELLKNLRAQYLLASHFPGLVRNKKDAVSELEEIYQRRERNEAWIVIE